MDKIFELETLLAKWKAVLNKTSRDALRAYNYAEGAVHGLEAAISIIKESSE